MAGKFLSQNEIATRVKAAREARGWTQKELGAHLDLPSDQRQQQVSKWERAERPIPNDYMERIAAVTERPLAYFVLSDGSAERRIDEIVIAEWLEARAQELRDGATSASSRAKKRAGATKGRKGKGGRRDRTGTGDPNAE